MSQNRIVAFFPPQLFINPCKLTRKKTKSLHAKLFFFGNIHIIRACTTYVQRITTHTSQISLHSHGFGRINRHKIEESERVRSARVVDHLFR